MRESSSAEFAAALDRGYQLRDWVDREEAHNEVEAWLTDVEGMLGVEASADRPVTDRFDLCLLHLRLSLGLETHDDTVHLEATDSMTEKDPADWVGIVGSTLAEFVGGRPAIALGGMLRLREAARDRANAALEAAVSSSASTAHAIEVIGRELDPQPLPEAELRFALDAITARQVAGPHDSDGLLAFLDERAAEVWRDQVAYREALSRDAYDTRSIQLICRDAGLPLERVDLQGPAEFQWQSVFEFLRTESPRSLLLLLHVAATRYPDDQDLRAWLPSA